MAWLYLQKAPLDEVVPLVRAGIRRYAASLGKTDGYHETVTRAYLILIDHRIDRFSGRETFESFARAHPTLLDRNLSALFTYDSREVLFSAEAIRMFVEPDQAPLPGRPES